MLLDKEALREKLLNLANHQVEFTTRTDDVNYMNRECLENES